MSGLLLSIVLLIMSARTLLVPFSGVLVYIWLALMNPHKITYGGFDIRWTQTITICCVIGILVASEKIKPKWNAVISILLIFYIWTLVTTYFAKFAVAPDTLFEFSKTILFVFLTTTLVNSKSRLHVLVWVIILSTSVYIIREGIYLVFSGGSHLIIGPRKSPYFGNNDLARLFGMVFPLILFMSFHCKNVLIRNGLRLLALLNLICVLGSQSRGAVVAFAVMAIFLFFKSSRKGQLLIVFIFSGLALGFILSQDNIDRYTDRYKTIENFSEERSFQSRTVAWDYGMSIVSRSPILGHGFGAYLGTRSILTGEGSDRQVHIRVQRKGYIDAHSIYFEVLGEHGIIGFILFVLMGMVAFVKCFLIQKKCEYDKTRYWERDLAIAIQGILVFYFVGGLVISHTYVEIYYFILAIVSVLIYLVGKESKAVDLANEELHLMKMAKSQSN